MKRCGEKGQAILEFAVILPVFLAVGFGLIDIQLVTERAANVDYIATETSRCMSVHGAACSGFNTPEKLADTIARGLQMDTKIMHVESAECDLLTCSTTISDRFEPIGPYGFHLTITRKGIAAVAEVVP